MAKMFKTMDCVMQSSEAMRFFLDSENSIYIKMHNNVRRGRSKRKNRAYSTTLHVNCTDPSNQIKSDVLKKRMAVCHAMQSKLVPSTALKQAQAYCRIQAFEQNNHPGERGAQPEELPAVACTRFQVPGSGLLPCPTKLSAHRGRKIGTRIVWEEQDA